MTLFGKNILFLRTNRSLQQAEMPEYTGVSRATWSDYERSKTEPDFKTLVKIAEFFGVAIDDLLKVDLSQNVHLIKNFEFSEDGKNVHLNVHEKVHLKGHNDGKVNQDLLSEKSSYIEVISQINKLASEVAEIKNTLHLKENKG